MTDAPGSIVEGWHNIVIRGAEDGAKAAKKRRKQRHPVATTDDDGSINE
jgi:hypothetical protein